MNEAATLPPDIVDSIGSPRYPKQADFPFELGS